MDKLREIILEALGQASMCWSETPKGVFDSEKVKGIAGVLLYDIMQLIQPNEPKLLTSLHEESISKHVTIRARPELEVAASIDWAIANGLDILSNKIGRVVHLINAIPVFRSDGEIFVTVIAAPMITENYIRKEFLEKRELEEGL